MAPAAPVPIANRLEFLVGCTPCLPARDLHFHWTLTVDGSGIANGLVEIPIPGCAMSVRYRASGQWLPTHLTQPSFLAGPENKLVAAAITCLLPEALTSADPSTGDATGPPLLTGPLLFWGPPGTGKTHLTRGLTKLWQDHFGQDAAEYLPASEFRRQLIDSIEQQNVNEFRQRLRSRRLLAIDDIHRLPCDHYLHEELLHTIDRLSMTGGRLLTTCAISPGMLTNLPQAIINRLAAGHFLCLSAPGAAARAQLVQRAASAFGRPLPDATAETIARGVAGTACDLLGIVAEMVYGPQRPASLSAADVAAYLSQRAARHRPEFADILRVVAKYYSLPQKVIKGNSRQQSVVMARGAAVYLARQTAGLSFQSIGRQLGGRDHTTIMHSFRKIQSLAERDLATQQALDDLTRILSSA